MSYDRLDDKDLRELINLHPADECLGECMQSCAFLELCDYRASGLTPERAAELARAEREGRLVVLPCKPGESLYLAKFNGAGEYEDPVEEMDYTGHLALYCDLPNFQGARVIPLSVIGKTVFLTREEAEAALERVNHAK